MKQIIEYSALLYALLIFIGYSYLDKFYGNFGIQIYSYLDASEILLSFLKNINYLIFISVILIIANVTKFIPTKNEEQPIKNKNTVLGFFSKNEKLWQNKRKYYPFYFGIITGGGFVVYYCKIAPFYAITVGAFILLLLFAYYIYKQLPIDFSELKKPVNLKYQKIGFFLITIFGFNYFSAYLAYLTIKENISIVDFSFQYNSTDYKSSDTLTYVGVTSKYIFLKNFKSTECYIINKDDIANLKIKQTEKYKDNLTLFGK